MEIFFGALLVSLLRNGVYSGNVKVNGNTLTRILNKNYNEDVVSVRSKIECTKLCISTQHCEAIYYNITFDKCFLRKYTPNILYPLVIDTSLASDTSVMFVRKHGEYCDVPPGYEFEPNLMFWYKLVKSPILTAWDAREFCRNEKTYLLLIDDDNQFYFTESLLEAHGVLTVYIQGFRKTDNDPYLDDMGRLMTYNKNWENGGTQGDGSYMRIELLAAGLIEPTPGGTKRPFICQLRLN